jgi:hypothetical protein
MSRKKRHYAQFAGQRVQLVEGRVVRILGHPNTGQELVVAIEPTAVTGALEVRIRCVRSSVHAPESRPLGHGISVAVGGTIELKGDLDRVPKRNEKLLMHLLYVGTDGFVCLAWTFKALADAVAVVRELSYAKVTATKLDNP